MWSNPDRLGKWLAEKTWPLLSGFSPQLIDQAHQHMPSSAEPRAVLEPLWRLFGSWQERSRPGTPMPNAYRQALLRVLTRQVRRLETSKRYDLMEQLWLASETYRTILGALTPPAELVTLTVSAINLLIGSEYRYMVGTRGNQPAWKPLNPAIRTQQDIETIFMYGPVNQIGYLEQSDIDLVPEWPLDLPGSILRYFQRPPTPFDTRSLLEHAYYNQQYALGPRGAYVRLEGFGPLLGMTLRVKPGLRDTGYVDFFVKFEVDAHALQPGKYQPGEVRESLIVIDGLFASGESDILGESKGAYAYLTSVVALIYHDLVTARDVALATSPGSETERIPGLSRTNGQSWIFAPTTPGGHPESIRTPLAQPRQGEPHHVRGHRRNRPISDRHQLALKEFEAETGLRILDVLLERYPGQTFVRPHVVPAQAHVDTLPRFIHRRLQTELDQALAHTTEGD